MDDVKPLWAASTFVTYIPGRILKQPIMVIIQEYPDDDWQILWPEAKLYGAGDTTEHAKGTFHREVDSLVHEFLSGELDDSVAPLLNFYFQWA